MEKSKKELPKKMDGKLEGSEFMASTMGIS